MRRQSHIVGPQLGVSHQTLDLGAQIREYAKVINRRIDYVHRNLGIMLFTSVVYSTPVDTGLARGSWWPSKVEPVLGGEQRYDKDGSAVIRDIQAVCMSAKLTDVLFMMNNVEYIGELEYGWSDQAPEGMVRINVARMRRMIKEIVASAKEVR